METLGYIDDFIRDVDQSRDVAKLAVALRKHLNLLGFERFSYQILRSPSGPRPDFYVSSYPEEWSKRYTEARHVSNDMVSRHGARVLRPFNWLEIGSVSSFTEDQKKVFYEAKEFGIASGGTVPIHGPGMAKALFTVASDRSQDEFGKLFKRHRHEIHIIATYAHEKILALGLLEKPEIDLDLTPRELEVLTWIARGKTRWEISEVLSISEETVKTHTEHACSKLGASNKTHASVVALVNGLIVP